MNCLRHSIFATAIAAVFVVVGGSTVHADLLAHWNFDETAGAITLIDSVNSYNGTAMSSDGVAPAPTAGATGQIGGAWSFAGAASSGGYIDLTTVRSNFTGLTQGTISAWFLTNDSKPGVIISAYDSTVGSTEGRIIIEPNGEIGFDTRDQSAALPGEGGRLDAGNGLDSTWHHIAAVINAGATVDAIYFDGVLAETEDEPFWGDITTPLDGMAIGRNIDSGSAPGGQWFWEGMIDDLQIYDEPLPTAAITAIYDAGVLGQSLEITATQVALEVDTTTGQVTLKNGTVLDFDIDAYRITSTGGSLNSVGWASLDDQGYDSDVWTELGKTSSELSEGAFGASSIVGNGVSINLGLAYDVGVDTQDLSFEIHSESDGATTFLDGTVSYITSLLGDMNGDGTVDADDVNPFVQALSNRTAYESQLFAVAYPDIIGDVNEDNSFDLGDIALFKTLVAGGSVASASVPEPSALLLLAVGAIGLVITQRTQQLSSLRLCRSREIIMP